MFFRIRFSRMKVLEINKLCLQGRLASHGRLFTILRWFFKSRVVICVNDIFDILVKFIIATLSKLNCSCLCILQKWI